MTDVSKRCGVSIYRSDDEPSLRPLRAGTGCRHVLLMKDFKICWVPIYTTWICHSQQIRMNKEQSLLLKKSYETYFKRNSVQHILTSIPYRIQRRGVVGWGAEARQWRPRRPGCFLITRKSHRVGVVSELQGVSLKSPFLLSKLGLCPFLVIFRRPPQNQIPGLGRLK